MNEAESSIQPKSISCSGIASDGEIKYIIIPNPYKKATKYLKALMKLFLAGNDSRKIFIEAGEPSTSSRIVVGQFEHAILYLLILTIISSCSSL